MPAACPALAQHHVRVGECGRELEGRDFGEWARNLRSSPRKQGERCRSGQRRAASGAAAACAPSVVTCTAFPLPLPLSGVLIAAMYSAAPALDRIRQEKEEALVAAYAAREAEAVASVAEADGQR